MLLTRFQISSLKKQPPWVAKTLHYKRKRGSPTIKQVFKVIENIDYLENTELEFCFVVGTLPICAINFIKCEFKKFRIPPVPPTKGSPWFVPLR